MIKKSKIFINKIIDKQELKNLIKGAFEIYGQRKAAYFVDQLKELGFNYATKSGISISLEDLRTPPIKVPLMQKASTKIIQTDDQANHGEITEVERFQKIIHVWNTTSTELKDRLVTFFKKADPLNSVYIMAFSGARGNLEQVRQLVGMRGLMSDPSGNIIDRAIGTNFREGLSITDYIISSYGARKGLVDTAIKTADSGYLTRRLVEVAQRIIISELDCKTYKGIIVEDETLNFFKEQLQGRLLAFTIFKPGTEIVVGYRNQQITPSLLKEFINLKIKRIIIRSPLTCICRRAICQSCYGQNLASGNLVSLGETVGLIAAQSIGEPGTQLTMRTFHTGGVYTGELVRQIRSKVSGSMTFSSTLKVKSYRTDYGQDAMVSKNNSWLNVTNYANQVIKIEVQARTIILIKEHDFVKRNQVLFEAASKLKEINLAEKAIKYVYAKQAGEIILEKDGSPFTINSKDFIKKSKKNCIFWILSGDVYNTPINIKLKARKLAKIYTGQAIAQSKIVTTVGGFISLLKRKLSEEFNTLKVQSYSQSKSNLNIYLEIKEFKNIYYKIYLSFNDEIEFKLNFLDNQMFYIGVRVNKKYKTKTGGLFFIADPSKSVTQGSSKSQSIQSGSTIFYIPQATYKITKNIENLKLVKLIKNTFIKKHQEILPFYVTNLSGFLKYYDDTNTITITPGQHYSLEITQKIYEEYHLQVYYPGEIILNNIQIKVLSYIEFDIGVDPKNIFIAYLSIRPITRYEFSPEESIKDTKLKDLTSLNLISENLNLTISSGEEVEQDSPIQFINSPVRVNYPTNLRNSNILLQIKGPKNYNNKSKILLSYSQVFDFNETVPKEILKKDVFLNILVEDKQFLDPFSILGSYDHINISNNCISTIKIKKTAKKSTLLINTKLDYQEIFLDNFSHKYNQNSFLRGNTLINSNILIKNSGLIKKVLGNKIILHLGHSYLFSTGALIKKLPSDYVLKQENLGQLIYERLKTGDIVQGLPKIDAILEARTPAFEALLSTGQSFIKDIKSNSKYTQLITVPRKTGYYNIPCTERLLVQKYEIISVGQPLTEGALNPHTLLSIYFDYFYSLGILSVYEAAYRSLKKLQTLILMSIQKIYNSQGVTISSKHVELIIREMTHKVSILHGGKTSFLPGDIIDLDQARYINLSLNNQTKIEFYPILLGITKASLKKDGFLAASSFQETTNILTLAAIQGRTDWLQGLKENVIVGRLIPAGTGFYMNQDITFHKALIPRKNPREGGSLSLLNQFKLKEKNMKKLQNKFKKIKNFYG
uniref:DNA-directed RNA polymerase n=1 Tax=Phaeophyceae sp. TaxID=2249243 RepID=A0A8E5F971_9PHAE|nr:DNA-directed RNA polymerase beta' chain [Phaeophyceae sp.]